MINKTLLYNILLLCKIHTYRTILLFWWIIPGIWIADAIDYVNNVIDISRLFLNLFTSTIIMLGAFILASILYVLLSLVDKSRFDRIRGERIDAEAARRLL